MDHKNKHNLPQLREMPEGAQVIYVDWEREPLPDEPVKILRIYRARRSGTYLLPDDLNTEAFENVPPERFQT